MTGPADGLPPRSVGVASIEVAICAVVGVAVFAGWAYQGLIRLKDKLGKKRTSAKPKTMPAECAADARVWN